MATWITLPSVSLTNGSNTVSVTGSIDLSAVKAGWALIINSNYVEIASGTSADSNGNSTLMLALPWDGSVVTNQPAKIQPTAAPFLAGIAALEDTNRYAIDVHNTLAEIATLDKDVTITDPTGTEHTFATMPKNARLIDEMITSANADVAELLAIKAVDGDDTTEGALLTVGATVKQLDLTNSNVKFEPEVQPTLDADFTKNTCRIYDSAENGFVEKTIAEVFDITRDTATTVTTPTGKLATIGIDKPAFDFEGGVAKGLRVNQRYTNLITQSQAAIPTNSQGVTLTTVNTTLPSGEIGNVSNIVITDTEVSYHLRYGDSSGGLGVIGENYSGFVYIRSLSGDVDIAIDFNDLNVKTYTVKQEWTKIHVSALASNTRRYMDIFVSDINAELQVSCSQITQTPCPMPYVKTEDGQVTVEPDYTSKTLGEEFNFTDFTIYLDKGAESIVNAFTIAIGESGTNYLGLNYNDEALIFFPPFQNSILTENNNDALSPHKFAVSCLAKDGAVRLLVVRDGVTLLDQEYAGDPSVFRSWHQISLGSRFGSFRRNTNVKKLKLYPKALSESDCIQLTKGAN